MRSIDRNGAQRAWSQRWLAEFDASLGLAPTSGTPLQLLRPVNGAQGVQGIPLLEWWPVASATSYTVTIATDPAMADTVVVATAQYPAYAHTEVLPYDTYYWQVQAADGTSPVGTASEVRRFEIAAQDRWREVQPSPMVSDTHTKTLVAQDGVGEGTPDLANLYVANDALYWNIGFDVVTTAVSFDYMILIDVNRADGMGAPSDPVYGLSVITAHRPEYAELPTSGRLHSGDRWLQHNADSLLCLRVGNVADATGPAEHRGKVCTTRTHLPLLWCLMAFCRCGWGSARWALREPWPSRS